MAVIGLKNLCNPALFYLYISIAALLVMWIQNMGNESIYCLGSYSCNVSSTTFIFIIKIMYILFWTWLLNIICKSGFSYISWFLVLFPFILSFILIASLFLIEFDNPLSGGNLSNIQNYNIPFFSSFYQWMRY